MEKLFFSLFVFAVFGLLTFTSCGDNANRTTSETEVVVQGDSVTDMDDDVDIDVEKTELRRDIEEAKQKIDTKLEALRADLKTASADAKVEINVKIDSLEAKKERLDHDMEDLGSELKTDWQTFKANVRRTLDELEDDIDEKI